LLGAAGDEQSRPGLGAVAPRLLRFARNDSEWFRALRVGDAGRELAGNSSGKTSLARVADFAEKLLMGSRFELHGGGHTSASTTPSGTWSIWTRTGMRCARRTQVKIGLTLASPCALGCAFETLMPRAMLSTWPQDLRVNHQLYAGRVGDADRFKIGFFEVAVDPERVGIDDRDLVLSDIGEITVGRRGSPRRKTGRSPHTSHWCARPSERNGAAP
jgi:hypothetical protein